jgi:pantothenate kinase
MTEVCTAAELAEDIRRAAAGRQRLIVGIAGAPGAGKSTLADQLSALLGNDSVLVPMDGFHLANRVLADLGRQQRKGAPDTFDAYGYLALLRRLRQQSEDVVYAPTFRRDLEEPIAGSVAVSRQTPIVVTEGNYLLLGTPPWSEVREILDLAWFLEVDHDTRVGRLVARHQTYGRTIQAARGRAEGSDELNAILVSESRHRADRIVCIDAARRQEGVHD